MASKFHFVIVPEDGGDSISVSCDTLQELIKKVHEAILKVGKGEIFIFVDGEKASLSLPKQVFTLKTADGKEHIVSGSEGYSYPDGGKFFSLKAP